MRKWFVVLWAVFMCCPATAAPKAARAPRAYQVAARLPDVARFPLLSQVHLGGYLGARVNRNEANRLRIVDLEPLLAGYRKRPGDHPWIGEHIGKWLHAATLAWAYTGDPHLRTRLDYAARELVKTQEADGYLGTYTPDKRLGLYPDAEWDVWSHKYNLIGLLTYYQYTGSPDALTACRRMGGLLLRTFGPGKKSILAAGTHNGMAATSVLEPMVLLYRTTGDARYLDFCRYIVASWEEPNGPHLLTTLTTVKAVNKTSTGKAYEMLSNLVGLCELARATGSKGYLVPALNAWQDIVAHQRYLTGTASYKEHFHANNDLPNDPASNVGETCVTVTWIQLNEQLLRLTGEARYGDEIERSLYNHLAAAQRPNGSQWCYYTALEGTKPYGTTITCCASSGPRGMAMAPVFAYFTTRQGDSDTLAVSLLDSSRATLSLDGQIVTADLKSGFPRAGDATLTFRLSKPARFAVQVRSPRWAGSVALQTGQRGAKADVKDGWTRLPARSWKNGDQVRVRFALKAQVVEGSNGNRGRATLLWGPFVLAYDQSRNAYLPSFATMRFDNKAEAQARLLVSSTEIPLAVSAPVQSSRVRRNWQGIFVPFADAGSSGKAYRVWLPSAQAASLAGASLLTEGQESQSFNGNISGSLNDGIFDSFVVTYNNQPQETAYFAVTVERPLAVRRIVFVQGRAFHDGGWFDTSRGKPRIEVQRTRGGDWETLGTLDAYPATTAAQPGSLRDGQAITLTLPKPETVVAVRVVGTPAHGDAPTQAFASCAELQAFAE